MENNEIIFYDNTRNYELYNEAKQSLFEQERHEYAWLSPDDIPEDMIYDEIDDMDYIAYDDFSKEFDRFIQGGLFLIMGTCGRWNGPVSCGRFVRSFADIQNFVSHLDHIKYYEKDGHLYIYGYHHDGSDNYEIKRLTPKGIAYAEKYDFAHDKNLHDTIMNTPLYSVLPNAYTAIYGGVE